MHQVDEVRDALDREFPTYSGRAGDWEDVLARSLATEPKRRRRRSPLIALAAAVGAVAAAVLFWPGGDGSARILERARAVASAGPVVHLVLAPEDGRMTELDLETGERRRLQGRHEQWFDPDRGVHDLHTIDGRVYRDWLYPAGSFPELESKFLGLGSAYRRALESGRATLGGKGTVDGRDVYWIRFRVRYPSFGLPLYHAEHEVAVDAETFEPRVWRSTPENDATGVREPMKVEIELWETLPAGSGDFTAATNVIERQGDPVEADELGFVRRPRTPTQARSVLSPPPLWVGREFKGLPLAAMYEVRERGKSGVSVCYGARLNNTSCAAPKAGRFIGMEQTNVPFGLDQVPEPAEGTMIISDDQPVVGFVHKEGVYVVINASDQDLLVAGARALMHIP